ncbi:MAG: hypothetical protein ACI9HK_001503 [Pirellulaceae bacterium]
MWPAPNRHFYLNLAERDAFRAKWHFTMETWVRANTRVLWFAFGLVAASTFLFAIAAVLSSGTGFYFGLRVFCSGFTAALAIVLMIMLYLIRQPRLAYENGQLIVNLKPVDSIRVPAEFVECFFLGQGPSLLKQTAINKGSSETSTIVVRLAEAAKEWHEREVNAQLGQWCDGYIVIRGTWSEPITAELMSSLNSRLVEVHREQKREAKSTEAESEQAAH